MMLKTAADFQQLAQEHPFCTGFLLMADQKGLSEEEIQTGLVKAASVHPARQAELERFVAATGQPLTMVKAAGGWGDKLKQMAARRGESMSQLQKLTQPTVDLVNHGAQSAHNWAREHPKTVGGTGLGLAGGAAAAGIGYDMSKGRRTPAVASQAATSPTVTPVAAAPSPDVPTAKPGSSHMPAGSQPAELPIPAVPGSIAGPRSYGSAAPAAPRDIPATIAGPAGPTGPKIPPATAGSPSWYTNPALLGGGGLLALALAARAMQSGDEEDPDQGY